MCVDTRKQFSFSLIKSVLDTIGLNAFYNENKDNYLWPERVIGSVAVNKYKIDFNYINNNGPSKENFLKKDFYLKM